MPGTARHRRRGPVRARGDCPPTSTASSPSHPGHPLLDADTLAGLIAAHSAGPAAVTVLTTTLADPAGYGRVADQDREVTAIVEQADATRRSGTSARSTPGCTRSDIAPLRSALSRLSADNAQQELYLTDVISIVRSDGRVVHANHVDDAALVAGVNDRVQLAAIGAELSRRVVAGHHTPG